MLKKGDEVEAQVLEIDKANQRISLGVKQLRADPWSRIDPKFHMGDLVKGTVAKIASFGAFIQLKDDIDGLVHISQFSEDHVDRVKDVLKVGQEVEARVIKVDKVERRIGLSLKAVAYDEESSSAKRPPSMRFARARNSSASKKRSASPPRRASGPGGGVAAGREINFRDSALEKVIRETDETRIKAR